MTAALPDFSHLLMVRVHSESGNDVYKSTVESGVANAAFRAILLAAQNHVVDRGWEAPVSTCKPVCAILLIEPSVYPLSLVKANVGRLCRRC